MIATLLGYIPFVHPINAVFTWWYLLLLPLSLGVAMVYKALRLESLEHYWREVAVMVLQIVLAMIGLAVALWLVIQVVLPLLPAERL